MPDLPQSGGAASTRAIKRLALARTISLAGTDASAIAVSVALFVQTRSPLWLAAGMLVTIGGSALLAPAGGALADRFDRRRLMIAAELTGSASFALLAFFHSPPVILAVSVVATAAGAVFAPASGAAVPALAGAGRLDWANGLLALGANIGKTAGRIGAGVLVALIGTSAVFALDAVSFALSAFVVWSVRADFANGAARGPVGPKVRWTRLLSGDRVRPVVVASCAATFMTSFSMTAETVLAFHFGAGSLGLGALAAAWGLGMVGGSWLAARRLNEDNELSGLFAGRVISGLALLGVGVTPAFIGAVGLYAIGGAAGGYLLVATQGLLQRAAPAHALGRLLAAAESAKTAAFGVGVICAGVIVGAIGPRPTYVIVGFGVLVATLPLAAALLRERGGFAEFAGRLRPAEQGA